MPELPEVETIRRGLLPRLRGREVESVVFGDLKVLKTAAADFAGRIAGQRVRDIRRRGKFLILELDRSACVFHLGMTGQLTFRDPERTDSSGFTRHPITGLQRSLQHPPDRHTHLQLIFSDGSAVFFRDVRKFGKVYLFGLGDAGLERCLAKLGLEPFSPEYTLAAFLERFRNRKLRLKSLLLDQRFVAGVGNIYADEALFEAGIHPLRGVRSLRRFEKERLYEAILSVLRRGIEFGGTSLRDYVDSDGLQGSNQEDLRVYGRSGQPCLRCGTSLQKIVVSQRGTHFCPVCQPRSTRGVGGQMSRRAG